MALSITADIEMRALAAGYKVFHDVPVSNSSLLTLAASKTTFSWKGLVFLSEHILVAELEDADVADAERLFDIGLSYGKKFNRIPLLRGMQFGFIIIPVIVTKNPAQRLLQYVENGPRKHWALFEMPVVIDPSSGSATYFHGKALWGRFFFSNIQRTIQKIIEAKSQC